ncbi:MAG: adenosylcobalamin-dependent ribonucleoside-diphosphate reductase [Thermoguttaceae bacterium]|jgi:ribonucleoside-diphosphate reductase alpha chain
MIQDSYHPYESADSCEPRLTINASRVLEERYLSRDETGLVTETPTELFRRVAAAVAAAEAVWDARPEQRLAVKDEFYRLMASRAFLPNSPTLMNAGRRLGMLSACFVLPLEDSIEEIMSTARQIALVQRAGGGTGIDLSRLRPKGSIVRSSGGTTDGPISFLAMLSGITEAIQQGALRRGANMGVMRVDHPDILAFIDAKSDLSRLSNYNLSVAITDAFMEVLHSSPDQAHIVVDPHTGKRGLLSKRGGSAEYLDVSPARGGDGHYTVGEIWDRIVQRAWQTGDPGLIFIDEVNRHNQVPALGPIRATNPCGEQPLLPFEACNLGSINLAAFCNSVTDRRSGDQVRWEALRSTVELAVRFLDDVIEVNAYPTPEIEEATRATRKIGLGVMGFADMLFQLRVPYDSEQALELADRLGSFIREAGWTASERLGEIRGNFPAWSGSIWEADHNGRSMRNAHVVTIAPTGTISIIAGCSSGIEPIFSLAFHRHVLGGKNLIEVNPIFEAALQSHLADEKQIQRSLDYAATHGSIQDLASIPESLRAVFRTARDIGPEWHVRMQAAWQRHTDAAVSKTVNLCTEATPADVEAAFLLAHKLKCKGITVYRDGARPEQPMALKAKPEQSPRPVSGPVHPAKLPEVIPSVRLRQATPFGNMHLHVSVEPETGREREVFAQLGKGGDLANSDLEAICRLISLFLRLDGDIKMVIDQLGGIGSSLSVPAKGGRIKSLADGLARAMAKYVAVKEREGLGPILSGRINSLELPESSTAIVASTDQESLFKIKCPECNSAGTLAFEEGCLKCHACGYSIC